MPHSLRVRLKNLQRKGELTEKDIDRIFKALEQEPTEKITNDVWKDFKKRKAMMLEPCEDAVSRQAVLDCFNNKVTLPYDMDTGLLRAYLQTVVDAISKLPSVRPQPCDDAISRQAVLDEVNKKFNEINIILENLPSVRPQEQTGHWITMPIGFKCSKCNELEDRTTKHCPNCGARMVEPQEGAIRNDKS